MEFSPADPRMHVSHTGYDGATMVTGDGIRYRKFITQTYHTG